MKAVSKIGHLWNIHDICVLNFWCTEDVVLFWQFTVLFILHRCYLLLNENCITFSWDIKECNHCIISPSVRNIIMPHITNCITYAVKISTRITNMDFKKKNDGGAYSLLPLNQQVLNLPETEVEYNRHLANKIAKIVLISNHQDFRIFGILGYTSCRLRFLEFWTFP